MAAHVAITCTSTNLVRLPQSTSTVPDRSAYYELNFNVPQTVTAIPQVLVAVRVSA